MKTINCRACGGTVDVDEDDDTGRCGECGTTYTGPWHDPQIERSPIAEEDYAGPHAATPTDDESDEPGDVELVEFTIQLPQEHVDDLTANGHAPDEAIHRAIRLYREMFNPEELLAEGDLQRATAAEN